MPLEQSLILTVTFFTAVYRQILAVDYVADKDVNTDFLHIVIVIVHLLIAMHHDMVNVGKILKIVRKVNNYDDSR